MAIHMITGLPGNAKTLYAISQIKAKSEKEGRPVYYHGLKDCTLPWTELEDPKRWMDVPPNAIVFIDEAQIIFRSRSVGATPPEHVTALETHRHLGIDLVLTTQHPSFIDPHIRKLTNLHQHMVRVYGMEMSTIHQWRETRDNPDKNRKDSEQSKWAFDKSLYGTYKSAEVHTMKRQLPKRLFFLLSLPLVLGALIYLTYYILTKKVSPGAPAATSITQAAALPGRLGPPLPVEGSAKKPFNALEDAQNFVAMSTPRIAGLPSTAPKYDKLTEPRRVPVPAACIQRAASSAAASCKCYTQQGTPMSVEPAMCVEFARNGYFQEFDADADKQASNRTEAGVQALSNRPESATPERAQTGSVLVINAVSEPRTSEHPISKS